MASDVVRADGDWLALREPADADARAEELLDPLRAVLPARQGLVVHDLGSGTGSMARWLAPRLPGPQQWVLHDRDRDLLDRAATYPPPRAADGTEVRIETRGHDITRLGPGALAGADLLTASALLDMLTAAELERLVAGCTEAGCPLLFTLSVVGRVELQPADELDGDVMAAFNAHQRRTTAGGALLGPVASGAAVAHLEAAGFDVTVRPSLWRLGPRRRALTAAWLSGWVGPAVEQRPELAPVAEPYARRRLAQAAAGTLFVTVHHADLLALPRRTVTAQRASQTG
ncbi:class I SAM-dependent methyltransferase [Nocardioides sp.]|uniref:class I SAM-dependent methyltransferase n=1 Tax=Nocardioides sp. TaxID=35761 RepID=UPI002ED26FCC